MGYIMLFTTVLKENKAFQRCYKKGRFTADSILAAYYYPNGTPYNRLGITVSKKNGCAVERNRIKRIIRAAYRINEKKFPIVYDIVFVGRNNISEKKMQDVDKFINKRLLKDINKPFEKKKRPANKNTKNKK